MLWRKFDEAEGMGFGQILEINDAYQQKRKAVIQVDSLTWKHMEECRRLYGGSIDRNMTMTELAVGVNRYEITAELNVKNSTKLLFGVLINFQWRMYRNKFCREGGTRIIVERTEDALSSIWSQDIAQSWIDIHKEQKQVADCACPPQQEESEDASDVESDESEEEEELPVMKFFREHCLPNQAKIPEEPVQKQVPQPVVRPRRRRI